MKLSDLTERQLVYFYEIATRIWKFRGITYQPELLRLIFIHGYDRLRTMTTLTEIETKYFKLLPPEIDFSKSQEIATLYLEFLSKIQNYEVKCEEGLRLLDLERQEEERQRMAAHQILVLKQEEEARIKRVEEAKVRAKQARIDYEKAENQRYWAQDATAAAAAAAAGGAPAEGGEAAPAEGGEAPAEGGEAAPAEGGAQAAPEAPAEGGGEAAPESGSEFEF